MKQKIDNTTMSIQTIEEQKWVCGDYARPDDESRSAVIETELLMVPYNKLSRLTKGVAG